MGAKGSEFRTDFGSILAFTITIVVWYGLNICGVSVSACHACGMWQLSSLFSSQPPAGGIGFERKLDETSACLFQDDGKGTVFVQKRQFGGG